MKNNDFHPILDQDKLDPKNEGRTGRLLSQKSYNAVRKKQLEFNAAFKGTERLTARQENFICISATDPEENLTTLLTHQDIPGLEYPVIIGTKNEAVAIYTDKAIGRGALGQVFLGISLDTGKQYAVKVQKYSDSQSHNFEIRQETLILSLTGQLIDNAPLVETEYALENYDVQLLCQGENYFRSIYGEHYIKKTLFADQLLAMALGAAKALKNLHSLGYFHGDISLGNFVWDATLKETKIIDFGKSKKINEEGKCITYPGGTLLYLAPELWQMDEEDNVCYTEKTEVYGLGVLFIQLFLNRWLSISDSTVYSFLIQNPNNQGPPQPFIDAAPEIFDIERTEANPLFAKITPLIRRMVDVNPEKRPSLNQVITLLSKIQQGADLMRQSSDALLTYYQKQQDEVDQIERHRLITNHSAPSRIKFTRISQYYLL